MKNLFLVLCFSALNSPVMASPLGVDTVQKMETLRVAVRTWAPTCNGGLSTGKECNQFDSIEFAGLLCATGEQERCEEIKRAQGPNGRWWRSENLVERSEQNSFSRDMKGGLLFYFAQTKDIAGLERWMKYLSENDNKMCDDATDTRCKINISGWTQLGYLYDYLGLKRDPRVKKSSGLNDHVSIISARTAPKGYPLMLIGNDLLLLRKLKVEEKWMKKSAKILLERQPHNPFFQYLVHGKSEEWARTILESCPTEGSEKMDDFFVQRELTRNDAGELLIIRESWGPGNTNIPVKTMANGHDCLFLLNLALNKV